MKRFLPTFFCVALLFLVISPLNSWAAVSGMIEYSYANYKRENKDAADFEGSSFNQRYSLMYQSQGLLAAGRSGYYDYTIGAEWAAFNTDFDNEQVSGDISSDDLKLLYSGRVQIAPGALPFRLSAYSMDMGSNPFMEDGNFVVGGTGVVRPGLTTDLKTGQSIVSGVQLVAGIRNGSYLGKYRETLSKFPRVLLDYREVNHRDMDSFSPTKFRSRNLAFVSLNKKDNWFHYRVYDYQDFIHENRDRTDKTIILGTIDHTLKRHWINLTNWIKVSADANYTIFDDEASGYKENNLFDINLYSVMERRNLSISTFANLQREQQGGTIRKRLEVPVYVSKVLSPDTLMRASFLVDRLQENRDAANFSEDDDIYHGRIRYETFRSRNVRIDPSVEVENHVGDRGDGRAIRGLLEAYSNQRYRPRGTWRGGASLALFDGTSGGGLDTDLWEIDLHGGFDRSITPRMRYGVFQQLLFADGSYGASTTRLLVPGSSQGFSKRDGEGARLDSDFLRSLTNLYFDHTTSYRLKNRVELFLKYESHDSIDLKNVELRHRLDYTYKHLVVRSSSTLSIGDDDKGVGFNSTNLGSFQEITAPDKQLLNNSSISYRPNKFWVADLGIDTEWRQDDAGTSTILVHLKQEFSRNFYTANGIVRKLADIRQRLDFEKFKDGIERTATRFSLQGNYYPTHVLSFYSQAYYSHYDYRYDTLGYDFEAALKFPLVQLSFNYQFAMDEDGNYKDHRYEINARKLF